MKKMFFCFSVAITVLFCSISACLAQAASVDTKMFSASGIYVDETSTNAAMAREKAMQEGQKKALIMVMERITPSYMTGQLMELLPEDKDILNFVQDISVLNEKTSSVRYMATLEVRFNPDAVRELLRNNGVPFVRTSGKPILILPVYKSSGASPALLWGNNPWLQAWLNKTAESHMVPLLIPEGNEADFQKINIAQVLDGDISAAQSLARSYEAEGILVVELIRQSQRFSVKGKAMDELTALEIPDFSFSVPMAKDTATTLDIAVKKVVEHLENVWKEEQLVQFNEPASLVALISITDLKQWEMIRKRLERIPIISSFYLQAARAGVLQITIFYAESFERLQREMNKRRLDLTALSSGVFKLGIVDTTSFFNQPKEANSTDTKETETILFVPEPEVKTDPKPEPFTFPLQQKVPQKPSPFQNSYKPSPFQN